MNTFEMMVNARVSGKTYRTGNMGYSEVYGFHDLDAKTPWRGNAFKTLNELLYNDEWEENTPYTTIHEEDKNVLEEVLDIRIR